HAELDDSHSEQPRSRSADPAVSAAADAVVWDTRAAEDVASARLDGARRRGRSARHAVPAGDAQCGSPRLAQCKEACGEERNCCRARSRQRVETPPGPRAATLQRPAGGAEATARPAATAD